MKANKQGNEWVSCLMDNELTASEYEFDQPEAVKKLCQSPEAAQQWQRYHLIGEAMRQNLVNQNVAYDTNFTQRFADRLDSEETFHMADTDLAGGQVANDQSVQQLNRDNVVSINSVSANAEHVESTSVKATERPSGKPLLFGGFAVAATVAAAALFGLQLWDRKPQAGSVPVVADSVNGVSANDSQYVQPVSTPVSTPVSSQAAVRPITVNASVKTAIAQPLSTQDAKKQEQLNQYLIDHIQQSQGTQPAVPYIRANAE